MARYFRLVPKDGTLPLARGDEIKRADDLARAHFGAPPSDRDWYLGWYDRVGVLLACGEQPADLKKLVAEDLHPFLDWLEISYTVEAGWQP